MTKRKICVITSGRADYGLLRGVLKEINEDSSLVLQIVATGMHLSKIFGSTYKEIKKDDFKIDKRIPLPIGDDSEQGIANSIGIGIKKFSRAFGSLKPDLILVLGDRFEIFAAACAALVHKIPVAHLYGGEVTSGAFDEAFRHSITKMSHLHFVAHEIYKQRVIQLGEDPEHVFLIGSLGVENIKKTQFIEKSDLEDLLGIKFNEKNLLITFHPTTLDLDAPSEQFVQLLNVLSDLSDSTIIFTSPNSDTGGINLIRMIEDFTKINKNSYYIPSMGQQVYFSCIAQVDAIIGNSSSGIIEVASLKKATINIGNRQMGRIQPSNVINCLPEENSIRLAIDYIYSSEFRNSLRSCINPYEIDDSSKKVTRCLRYVDLDNIILKRFYDIL